MLPLLSCGVLNNACDEDDVRTEVAARASEIFKKNLKNLEEVGKFTPEVFGGDASIMGGLCSGTGDKFEGSCVLLPDVLEIMVVKDQPKPVLDINYAVINQLLAQARGKEKRVDSAAFVRSILDVYEAKTHVDFMETWLSIVEENVGLATGPRHLPILKAQDMTYENTTVKL